MDLRRDAERLFDVTMWCLGRDVNHPEGNLLLRRGLSRERPPQGQQANSVYTAWLPAGGVLKLWGFGVLCDGCDGAVYIARDGFTPRMVDREAVRWPVFDAEGLRASREPLSFEERRACRGAVVTLAEWLARYEGWVVDHLGPSWRFACLAERRKAPPVNAEELAAAWWRISTRARSLGFVVNDAIALVAGA
jgi:hypothetical protein